MCQRLRAALRPAPLSDAELSNGYDLNGNRTIAPGLIASPLYDAQDRLLAYGPYRFTYTPSGALETTTDTSTGGVSRYGSDALGNLLRVDLPDGRRVEYNVDPLNRRVGKKVDGVLVKRWVYSDQLAVAAEIDASGQVARFVSGGYFTKGGATYRLVRDHLTSVRLVVDTSTGAIAQRLEYDEYGRVLVDTNPGFQPLGFGGGLYDPDTGLVRFGARDYDALTGRWLDKDPLGFDGGDANLYAYAQNNPINYVDPYGTDVLNDLASYWYLQKYLKDLHRYRNKDANKCPNQPPAEDKAYPDGRTWDRALPHGPIWDKILPKDNKWRGSDGSECVYNDDGTPKTDEGSFNFSPKPWTVSHVLLDILPDHLWGPEVKGLTTYGPP
jgi:RHS repeat-associated protein